MNQYYQIQITQKRLSAFIELELGICPTSLGWMKQNVPLYDEIQGMFIKQESYEQAAIMNYDGEYLVFFSLVKLDSYPLIIEKKDVYSVEELVVICAKAKYPFDEALHYCMEDGILREEWAKVIDARKTPGKP